MFSHLHPDILASTDFKEDSVREEIIVPILKRLGYSASGQYKITRSKTLSVPFIQLGTRKYPVKIVPDYLLSDGPKPLLVLDAKAPSEDILQGSNVQQAYSYAIHPEIKCEHFALCNGRSLAIFSTNSPTPLLTVTFEEFEKRWSEIEKHIAPKYLLNPLLREYAPDLGLKLMSMGLPKGQEITFTSVQPTTFFKISDKLFTASGNCDFCGAIHCGSFDLSPRLMTEIIQALPGQLAKMFRDALRNAPFKAATEGVLEMDIAFRLGDQNTNDNETFIPLRVHKVHGARFIPQPTMPESNDIPSDIFRLRKAFVLSKKTPV